MALLNSTRFIVSYPIFIYINSHQIKNIVVFIKGFINLMLMEAHIEASKDSKNGDTSYKDGTSS